MLRTLSILIVISIALVGCKGKEHAEVAHPPAAVAPAVVVAPAVTTPAQVATPVKPAPTPGTFAAKEASTPKVEKPKSFAKKVAKPKAKTEVSSDKAPATEKKGFAKKVPK